MRPLPYYRDKPVPAKDMVIESYVRTTATPPARAPTPTTWSASRRRP